MRAAETYRGNRRRIEHPDIRFWRNKRLDNRANEAAKIALRADQCNRARMAVSAFIAQKGLTATKAGINSVLREFWQKQPRSRVNSRILRELGV